MALNPTNLILQVSSDSNFSLLSLFRNESSDTFNSNNDGTANSFGTKTSRPRIQRNIVIPRPQPPRQLQDVVSCDDLLSCDHRVAYCALLSLSSHCRGGGLTDKESAAANCTAIYEAGGHDLVVLAMVQHGKCPLIQATGLGIVQNMCYYAPTLRLASGQDGGIDYVLMVMDKYVDHEKVLRRACGALATLSLQCPENNATIIQLKGIPIIAKIMNRHPQSSVIQERIAYLLCNICQSWEDRHKLLLLDLDDYASGGGSSKDVLEEMEKFSFLDALYRSIRRFPKQSFLQEKAQRAKEYLNEYLSALNHKLVEYDLVGNRQTARKHEQEFRPNDPVLILRALKQVGKLCVSFKASERFYLNNGIPTILQAMSQHIAVDVQDDHDHLPAAASLSLEIAISGTFALYQLSNHCHRHEHIKKHLGGSVMRALMRTIEIYPNRHDIHMNAWFTIANMVCQSRQNATILLHELDGIKVLVADILKYTEMAQRNKESRRTGKATATANPSTGGDHDGHTNDDNAGEEKKEDSATKPLARDNQQQCHPNQNQQPQDRKSSSTRPISPLQVQLIGFWILQHICGWEEFRAHIKKTEKVAPVLALFRRVEKKSSHAYFCGCQTLIENLEHHALLD